LVGETFAGTDFMTIHPKLHMDAVDPLVFRRAMGGFATGVAVVTSLWKGEYHGMTMNSLTSVSLDPCMLLICPRRGSATGDAAVCSGEFVVNLLATHQQALSSRFVGAFEDRFAGIEVDRTEAGTPMLCGALAHIGCRVVDVHPAGDHDIIVAKVTFCRDGVGEPLVFYKGQFGGFADEPT
jgi:3-hydroxy-9,10-secoandrosta-1,3,5(10)-triene-9,17-dione monooxygenase reductase component